MPPAAQASSDSSDLWLGKPAPRYTSYPPASLFHPGVTAEEYGRSLAQLPPDEPVSLYVHIPFCRSLCLSCACNIAITHRHERVERYLAALKHEIALVAAILGRRRASGLHFGGGTPNILSGCDIRGLFDDLVKAFDFRDLVDVTMELDPRAVTQEQAETLAACGVTRVSLGIQDFDPLVQQVIRRHQPFDMVAKTCGWLRSAGIHRINFDLMYGLPKQTPETVAETARRVCELQPDRVALFCYAHMPQIKKHQKALEIFGLPDPRDKLALDQTVRGILANHGYYEIGMDHFARNKDALTKALRAGRLRRNFQGYTDDETPTLVGFGASSISQTYHGYFQNERDERAYGDILASGNLPVQRGFLLSLEDRVRRAIIEDLMCTLSCDIDAICRTYAYPIQRLADDFARMKPYEDAGIAVWRGYVLSLTTPYRMAARVICGIFDTYTRRAKISSSCTA